jgi:hypothetical protein
MGPDDTLHSPTIFAQIGIATNDTLKYQGINSVIALIAQFCCIMLIDWTGRRWANIGGAFRARDIHCP